MGGGMNAPPTQIVAALDALERKVTPFNLIKSGAVSKDSEAKYLLEMIREARLYIEVAEDRTRARQW